MASGMQALHEYEKPRPSGVTATGADLADLRFRTLIGERGWSELPGPVQRRFSKRIAPDEAVFYRGRVTETRLSRSGRLLAFLARLIGAPLPKRDGATGPAVVTVTEDPSFGGQSWTRIYGSAGRAPQVIHSVKRFRGKTGLEEYVGYGIGMALTVSVEDGAIHFRSDHYFVELGRMRLRLPAALTPCTMLIVHREEGNGEFTFRLSLRHARLGLLVSQLAYFEDA